jgi:2-polyprenyl-3-methyl-5-hydroxy-6-metoxy-1,4-benzoquinol methylase
MTDDSHYLALAAAYARGSLARPDLEDMAALQAAEEAGLRLHRFKRTAGLPRVKRVIGALRGFTPARLLDVGSGRGAFLWPLLDQLPGVAVTAVDLLPHRVEGLARVRAGGVARLTCARMDASALGFTADAFDVVTLLEVLEHMRRPEAAAVEALRVARTAVIVSVPSRPDDNPEHLHVLSEVRLRAMFVAGGARRVTMDPVLGHLVCVAVK